MSKHEYKYIDELNRDVERDLLGPLWKLPLFAALPFVGIWLVLKFSEDIDRLAMKHPVLLGSVLLVTSLIGLIVWVKKMTW